jgi:hypothetical protein
MKRGAELRFKLHAAFIAPLELHRCSDNRASGCPPECLSFAASKLKLTDIPLLVVFWP